MRRILIVGAGQSGLQLALGLQARDYDVTLLSNRTPDEMRAGRVTSTQVMFGTALRHERELGLGFWEEHAPGIEGFGYSVAGPPLPAAAPVPASAGRVRRIVDWVGRLDEPARSVDQRLKMAGWLETFAARGGTLVLHGATVCDLDFFAGRYDLVLVAAGKGELVSLFDRDPARSPYAAPQRCLALAYVHGLGPRPEHPEYDAVRCTLVPGVGELLVIPALTLSGRADILFWEGLPGGPLDVFGAGESPAEHLARMLELIERYAPWEYGRATQVELTDPGATLAGRYTPVVRDPVGRLPSGGLVLGIGDAVVVDDPVTGQGANSAAKSAAACLAAIVERGDGPFDEAWMRSVSDRHWSLAARHATRWTNAMLAPLPLHVQRLIGAASGCQPVADRFANGYDDPSDFEGWFYEEERAEAYLREVGGG
ncbi:styrene monooxygenase/indole monooxygenase family protein [Streptomyces sp. NPDC021100]|uniref:styrene monooxygenase/indole monooxygenase family protein n=1 Tax=Streptomyces sp. NPDC021100 TaxID=3365114 RepID=UPI0037B3D566